MFYNIKFSFLLIKLFCKNKGKEGIVDYYSKKYDEVIVRGINSYVKKPLSYDINRKEGIYSPKTTFKSDEVVLIGCNSATIEFEKIDLNEKNLKDLLINRLNLCKACSFLKINRFSDEKVTLSIRKPSDDCPGNHETIGNLSDLEPNECLTFDGKTLYIKNINIHTNIDDVLKCKLIHVPSNPFVKGDTVISISNDKNFGLKGVVIDNYLDKITVKFDEHKMVSGPFESKHFKEIKNDKIVKRSDTFFPTRVIANVENNENTIDCIQFTGNPKIKNDFDDIFGQMEFPNESLTTLIEDAKFNSLEKEEKTQI